MSCNYCDMKSILVTGIQFLSQEINLIRRIRFLWEACSNKLATLCESKQNFIWAYYTFLGTLVPRFPMNIPPRCENTILSIPTYGEGEGGYKIQRDSGKDMDGHQIRGTMIYLENQLWVQQIQACHLSLSHFSWNMVKNFPQLLISLVLCFSNPQSADASSVLG